MGTGRGPRFASAYVGRKWFVSIAFFNPARDLLVDKVKTVVGFARLFRPRYAQANLGHPSYPSDLAMTQTPRGRLRVSGRKRFKKNWAKAPTCPLAGYNVAP
jgi:hypothetical protein